MLDFLPETRHELVEEILRTVRDDLDLKYYCNAAICDKTGELRFRTSYPASWQDRYVNQAYGSIDPVLSALKSGARLVSWSDLREASSDKFFGEAMDFGLSPKGISIPIAGDHLFSFNVDTGGAKRLIDRPHIKSSLFTLAYLLHEDGLRPGDVHDQDEGNLSSREIEVLRWAASGKTSWETGVILGLSEKTVNFYIANACKRLRASNKTHAVAICLMRRLFDSGLRR